MIRTQKKTKLHAKHLLLKLHEKNQQATVPEEIDFYHLLEGMPVYYNLSPEVLILRGFHRAYRQVYLRSLILIILSIS